MYVECLTGTQTVCTHSRCQERTERCGEPNPTDSWRTCRQTKGHKGKHYVPPESFNYEYWGEH